MHVNDGSSKTIHMIKVLIDNGSKVNFLPYRVFQLMNIIRENLVSSQALIKGIRGVPIPMEGKIHLPMTLGQTPLARTQYVTFLVVKIPMLYNAILGRAVLYDFEIAISIKYVMIKFITVNGIAIIRGR
ncbi:hypothetical protein P3X46_005729 [Hevea brasiliensis]|uniref:Aspartic peptidase DDI1-type domain-containing protein n=1 Tax=Hevea brasiliensis TaxID=3981 RepID=A0ABQ9N0V5_HEVBR|nr:hypothetical protein P3X46_005729 [Hevea brasiliensis]